MPYVSYSRAAKAEAVALARVVGVANASEQLGIQAATISRWLEAAGISAGDSELDTDELARFERLAYAKLEGDLVSGRLKGTQLVTAWGVVKDKLNRREREGRRDAEPPKDPVADALDAFLAWAIEARPDLVKHYGTAEHTVSALLRAILRRERMREWAWEMAGLQYEVRDASYGEL